MKQPNSPAAALLIIAVFSLILTTELSHAAAESIRVDETFTKYKIGLNFEYLEDVNGALGIEDVTGNTLRSTWTQAQKSGFFITNSVYWVRLSVENPGETDRSVLLQQAYPMVDDLRLYSPRDGGEFDIIEVGDYKPFSKRPYEHRTFVFPLKIKARSKVTYYLRQKTTSFMNLHLNLWSPPVFQKKTATEERMLMLYYGIILVMIIYNFVLFVFIRHRSYLYYVLFTAFFLIFIMTQNGTAFQFLWPGFPWWANFIIPISLCLALHFSALFTMYFLRLKKNAPRLFKILFGIMCVNAISFLLCFVLPYGPAILISAILIMLLIALSFFTAIWLSLKRKRSAYFYLASFCMFLVGGLLFLFKAFGLLPDTFIVNWSLQIGSAAQVVLLSAALADQINTLRKNSKGLGLEADRLNTDQQEMLRTAGQLNEMLNNVVNTVNETSSSFSTQANQLAAAIKEISTTMTHVNHLAGETLSSADTTRIAAEKGKEKSITSNLMLKDLAQGFNELSKFNDVAHAEFAELAAKAENIEDIIVANQEIAGRIKILAVNAGIQAAKAGKYGTGFRVVAAELKGMITDTDESFNQSVELLGEIRTRARQSSEALEQSIHILNVQLKELGSTGTLIEEMSEAFTATAKRVSRITDDAQKQQARLTEVGTGIEHVDNAAERLAHSTTTLLGSIEKIAASHDELSEILSTRTSNN
ncbi:MAG: hypothetical protein GY854_32025 [Deltaproteobacteria bacterium]|nr:hypothetical protein [Deltaproteobacteria bacterium]